MKVLLLVTMATVNNNRGLAKLKALPTCIPGPTGGLARLGEPGNPRYGVLASRSTSSPRPKNGVPFSSGKGTPFTDHLPMGSGGGGDAKRAPLAAGTDGSIGGAVRNSGRNTGLRSLDHCSASLSHR